MAGGLKIRFLGNSLEIHKSVSKDTEFVVSLL